MYDLYKQCHCGGHFGCEGCHLDVCFCACDKDGTPDTRAEVTAHPINHDLEHLNAWQEKWALTR